VITWILGVCKTLPVQIFLREYLTLQNETASEYFLLILIFFSYAVEYGNSATNINSYESPALPQAPHNIRMHILAAAFIFLIYCDIYICRGFPQANTADRDARAGAAPAHRP
jgi:hypothetical protein